MTQLTEQLASGPGPAPRAVDPADGDVAPAAGAEWWSGYTRMTPPRLPLTVVRELPPPSIGHTFVPGPVPVPVPVSVPVPVPGRHAARRPRTPVGLVPETLRGRVQLGPSQVAVVAVLVACGLAFTCWWVVRGDPERPVAVTPAVSAPGDLLAQPVEVPDGAPAAPAISPPQAPDADGATVTVDVAGRVRHPGIVVLGPGSRVVDALRKAGGARPGVDLTALNLARPLLDGEQIVVGTPGAAVPLPGASPPPVTGAVPTALVDLNLASQVELETLPDVGPVTATAIIAWRDEHGGFTAVTELLEVDGIGDVTLAKLTPLVTV